MTVDSPAPAPKRQRKRHRRGALSIEAREELHAALDRILDTRNFYERARVDPSFRRFKPVKELPASAPRVSEALVEAKILFDQGLSFIAEVIGEEVLLLMQPDIDVERAARREAGLRSLFIRLAPLLRTGRRRLAMHQLVALLWLSRKIRDGRNNKGAKGELGDAYGLGKDAIPKWEKACRKALGSKVDQTLEFAESLRAELFFAAVFGIDHGTKSLAECAEAYHACARSLRRSQRRGRPRENRAD